MYITVLPPGRGLKERARWWLGVIGHITGVGAGAVTAAFTWFGIGRLFGGLTTVAVGMIAVGMGLAGSKLMPLRVFSSPWRIPQTWRRLGSVGYPTVFGYCLGLGLLTALSSSALYVVIAFGLAALSLPSVLLVFAAFALGRMLGPLALSVLATFGTDEADALERLEERSLWAGPLEAVALLTYGLVTLFG